MAEIHDFIALDNAQAAKKVIGIIRKVAEKLREQPYVGRVGRITGTRELIVDRLPFMLAYRVDSSEVQILSVIHTSRMWPESL